MISRVSAFHIDDKIYGGKVQLTGLDPPSTLFENIHILKQIVTSTMLATPVAQHQSHHLLSMSGTQDRLSQLVIEHYIVLYQN